MENLSMEINKIYNEDCFETMLHMVENNQKVNIILTSPPYCTPNDDARKYTEFKFTNYQVHYDVFEGWDSPEDYRRWTIHLFQAYDTILEKDGVVLYNISYTAKNPDLVYLVIADIINNTAFTVADCISWKKNNALPQNQNANRLTRICEFVFVLCRKSELSTFKTNKKRSGSKYTNLSYNYIEAPNNDILSTKVNKLNNATFSTAFVRELLNMYASTDSVVYDSFMGTGTTAVACKAFGCNYIGSELSEAQVEFANVRLTGVQNLFKPNVADLF